MDETLIKLMEEMAEIERWKKKAKIKGKLIKKSFTKNDNILLSIQRKKSVAKVLVNKNFPELFKIARNLNLHSMVYVEGKRELGIVYCDKLSLLQGKTNLEKAPSFDKLEIVGKGKRADKQMTIY